MRAAGNNNSWTGSASRNSRSRFLLVAGALGAALTVFLLFFIAARPNQFVGFDDYSYIVENRQLETFGWDGIIAAFTSFTAGNWHPVTMLSLLLDRQLWGLDPAGFHLTAVAIHSATVFCLCFLFYELLQVICKKPPRSAADSFCGEGSLAPLVAAIGGALFFGLHPLRVESVVWAAERKDVLCLFFITAALWSYLRYALKTVALPTARLRSTAFYLASLCFTGLALMSKPLAISLPLVLLLADWYPLGRLTGRTALVRCAVEKIPFALLAGVDLAMTLLAQRVAMDKLPDLTAASRLLVACKALLFYLVKTVYPGRLAPFYDHPGNVVASALPEYLGYAALVGAICLTIALAARRTRLWPALWLFYCLTLLPMLGLIQVGRQWVADRYSYLPSLGLALLWGGGFVWLCCRLREKGRRVAATACLLLAAGQLALNTVVTLRLIPIWHDTGTLTTRVIDLAPHRAARPYLARAAHRFNNGENEPALDDIEEAMLIAVRRGDSELYPQLGSTRARILYRLGRRQEALQAADWAIKAGSRQLPAYFFRFRDDLARELSVTSSADPGIPVAPPSRGGE